MTTLLPAGSWLGLFLAAQVALGSVLGYRSVHER
jgi:hypothetical protein